jgi:hypothetical protein
MVVGLLLDLVFPVVTYYALRALAVDPWMALLGGALAAKLRVLYVAARWRVFDAFAAFWMTVYAVSLIASFVSGDARFLLVKDSFATAVAGLFFLGSCVAGRPLVYYSVRRMLAAQPERAARMEGMWAASPSYRRVFRVMSVVWGAGLLAEALARVPLVYLLPTDVMAGLSSLMFASAMLLLLAWNIWYGKRLPAIVRNEPILARHEPALRPGPNQYRKLDGEI